MRVRLFRSPLPFLSSVLLCALGGTAVSQVPQSLLDDLTWREVGPYRGGRSAAVAGIDGDPMTYYFGAAGGGVWQTRDGGASWKNVSDGHFGGSIGAVAVAPSNHNVIYVGGGEKTVRGNVSHGDGAWRSDDAGRTWRRIGLPDSRHICRMRVHPRDENLVYAAVLGHLFGPNAERGVYRSKDGGERWERVLHISDEAGAVDLAMDPTNPRVLYACLWKVRRTPYSLESGGQGSGIWKSTDGGDTWVEIGRNPGLPQGTVGISGICVSKADSDNLYAIVEAEEGGVFRSRDAGETWAKVNSERSLRQRAWYYSRIYADPADVDACYVLNVGFHRSIDGGKTFSRISTPHGDNHDLWIAADDPQRMIESNDGGANVSFDGGKTWSRQDNQPTAQFYRVSTDNSVPYRILGAQQDNSAVRIRHRALSGGAITDRDWEPTAGGESGHIVAKPDEPNLVFGGSYGGYLTWLDHGTGHGRSVNVWPDNPMGWGTEDLRHRFQWNFPLFFSPHDPNVLYAAGERLFRSKDLGHSWSAISADLTRNDKARQGSSGGPITKDNTGVEYYCTVFAAAESQHEPGVLWAGSDDGLLHVTRNGGESWKPVTPPSLPEWAQINSLEIDPFRKGGLYLAATRYKSDDFRPYLFRTEDYGATWTEITAGIADDHFTRVIRADPVQQGLLYAGTERGVYVSFDDGGSWRSLQGSLPIVPITDLAWKDMDLIAATQGRGFWSLDDVSILHRWAQSSDLARAEAGLFAPRPTVQWVVGGRSRGGNAGKSPTAGVVFRYALSPEAAAAAEARLELFDAGGTLVRAFTQKPAPGEKAERDDAGETTAVLTTEAGLNEFAWDMRYPGAEKFDGMVLWNSRLAGPKAVPGGYRAKLTVGETESAVDFAILPDPMSRATDADRQAQFAFLLEVRNKLTETHRGIKQLRKVRKAVKSMLERAEELDESVLEELRGAAEKVTDELTVIEEALYQTKSKSRQDPLNFPIRLNDKLAGLLSVVGRGDHAPPKQALQVRDELTAAIDAQLVRLQQLMDEAVPGLNRRAAEAGVPAIR